MLKMDLEAKKAAQARKNRIIDIALVLLILIIAYLAMTMPEVSTLSQRILIAVPIVLLLILSVVKYFLVIPKGPMNSGLSSPILVPKVMGIGWGINPRNPIGIGIYLVIFGIIVYALIFGN